MDVGGLPPVFLNRIHQSVCLNMVSLGLQRAQPKLQMNAEPCGQSVFSG